MIRFYDRIETRFNEAAGYYPRKPLETGAGT